MSLKNRPKKVRPSIAAGPHRVLTIEVWHQTSGRKGTNNLREYQLVPAGIDMEACHRKCVTLYWSSSSDTEYPTDAWYLFTKKGRYVGEYCSSRYYGHSVRPVTEE